VYRSSTGVQEYFRGHDYNKVSEVLQVYRSRTRLLGCSVVVQGYRCAGLVEGYRGTGVVHVYNEYRRSTGVQM